MSEAAKRLNSEPKPAQERKPIPVKQLLFPYATPINGPGLSVVSSIEHRSAYRNSEHEIEYHPWMRHFMVTYIPRDALKPKEVFFGHETKPDDWIPL